MAGYPDEDEDFSQELQNEENSDLSDEDTEEEEESSDSEDCSDDDDGSSNMVTEKDMLYEKIIQSGLKSHKRSSNVFHRYNKMHWKL